MLAPFHFPGAEGGVFRSSLQSAAALWWIHAIGTGGEARCAVLFCAFVVQLLRGGGARENGFWCIVTVGGGAFGICMPACREGDYTELLFFVLAPFNFPGPASGIFGGSVQSAAVLLVDICERDRRGGTMNRFRLRFRR